MLRIVKAKKNNFACVRVGKAKTVNQQRNELLRYAQKYQATVRRKFIEAIQGIKSEAKMKRIAGMIAAGKSDYEIADAVGVEFIEPAFGKVTDELNNAYRTGGVVAANDAAAGVVGGPKMLARFDSNNERAANWLRNYNAKLVTSLTREARTVITQTLAAGLEVARTPTDVARDIRQVLGLTPRQSQALRNYRKALEQGSMKATNYAIGSKAEQMIMAAYRDGTMSQKKINDLVERYSQRLLIQRSNVVAQTESFRSLNAGNNEGWRQVIESTGVDEKYVRRFWVATNDSLTREAHLDIVEMNPDGVGLDEPFDSPLGPIMYPGDPTADAANTINCRCTVVIRLVDVPDGALPPVIAGRSYLPDAPNFVDLTTRGRQ